MKLTARQIAFLLFAMLLVTRAFVDDSSILGGLITIAISIIIFIVIVAIILRAIGGLGRDANAIALKEMDRKAEFATNAKNRLTEIIVDHLPTLAIKHQQTNVKDDYGIVDVTRWDKEINYFIEKVLWSDPIVGGYLGGTDSLDSKKTLDAISARLDELLAMGVGKAPQVDINILKAGVAAINQKNAERARETKILINDLVSEYRINEAENFRHLSIDIDKLDPIQFEHYCAEILRGNGWDARVTQASGDQGIDVIANLGNVKAVLQCKKYSQPVGNAAVQEVIAGKAFEQAHVAAVVSNATYTPSAKQLASTTGVHLLHFSELPHFAERLGLIKAGL